MNTKLKNLICAALAGGTFLFGAAAPVCAARTGIKGDVNNDGKISASDLTLLLDYVKGKNVSIDLDNADVNGDGKVNIMDVNLINQYITGMIKEFPASQKKNNTTTPQNRTNTAHNPEGYVDSVVSNAPNQITVRGWTLDRDNVNTALEVHVYVGGGTGSGAPGFRLTANKYRPDVNQVHSGVGNYHGYEGTISVNKTGRQEVHVYAINIAGGNNIELGVKTVDIKGSTSSPTQVPVTIANGWYKIHPSHDRGRSLDALGPNNNLHLWTNVDAPQQKFYLQDRGGGYFSLQTAGGNRLYVTAEGNGAGANLDMKPWTNSNSQLFLLLTGGSGTYHIVSKANQNLNFDCAGAGKADGTNAQLWTTEAGSAHHKWIFEKTSAPASTPTVPTPPTVPNALVGQVITAKRDVSSYQDSGLLQRIGSVDKGDSCTILAVSGDSYKVRYPITRNGRPTGRTKDGWVSKEIFEEVSIQEGFLYPLKGRNIEWSSTLKTNGQRCDYVAPSGTPLYAPADGTVQFMQTYSTTYKKLASYGNQILFTSSDGTYTVRCAHLSSFNGVSLKYTSSLSYPCGTSKYKCETISLLAKPRQVKKGELLGYTGMTGNASGPHVHIEVKKNGVAVDPKAVFSTWN